MGTRLLLAMRAELRDRRGSLLGALTFAALLAVGAPVALALAGALAVFGFRLVLGLLPAVLRSSRPTDEWTVRAEIAVSSLRRLSRRARRGPVAERCRAIADSAMQTLGQLAELAAHEATVGALLANVERVPLAEERGALEREMRAATSVDQEDLTRSLAAVDRQAAVRDQLMASRRTLQRRMRTVAIGLEGLVAQLAQVLALTASGLGVADDRVAELEAALEALRDGLAETEVYGRQTIASIARPQQEVQ